MQASNDPHSRPSMGNHKIAISNIKDGEVLSYSLALIKGHILTTPPSVPPLNECNISVLHKHECSTRPISTSEWPVQKFEFKVLVDLSCGNNQLTFQYLNATLTLAVSFEVRKSVFHVTPVYIVCKGHDGRFQAPPQEDNSVGSACRRIATGARLIQSLTAEKLAETNLGRKTFQLGCDISESAAQCVVFYSALCVERARGMAAGELWEHLGRELMLSPLGSDRRKFMAFLSCTRYRADGTELPRQTHEEMLALTEAHAALGGGGLALFGTACLHTWPTCVEEVQPRFLDQTRVDTQRLMDDSCYRGTYGGCFATTLGAVCHELGHTFDLGHSDEGIMGRGFDNVDLVFCLPSCGDVNKNVVPPDDDDDAVKGVAQHATICFTHTLNVSYTLASPIRRPRRNIQSSRSVKQLDARATSYQNNENVGRRNNMNTSLKNNDDLTFWSDSCAVLLSFHRWFNDGPPLPLSGGLRYQSTRKLLTSKAGIRIVEIRDPTGLVLHYWEFLGSRGREMFILPSGAWHQADNTLVAEDSDGNVLKYCLASVDLPPL